MTTGLPAGHTWRRATLADAEAIHGLVSGYHIEVVGAADVSLEDFRNNLAEPGFDLATDSWLGYEPDGALAGFAWTYGKGGGQEVDVGLYARDDALAGWFYEQVLARAADLARAGGHASCAVDVGIYREDTKAGAVAERHGFTPRTVFLRMRVDHGEPAPCPAPPAGLSVHIGPGDEQFRRTAHSVLKESFADHYGWFARSFEDWHQTLEQESTFDWSQLAVATLDSRPVAILVTSDRFLTDENCGYVSDIGVVAQARGRGIAKHLLRTAFAADIAAGRTGTILYVDANNVTPAMGLYESVGMRPVRVIDIWRQELSAQDARQGDRSRPG